MEASRPDRDDVTPLLEARGAVQVVPGPAGAGRLRPASRAPGDPRRDRPERRRQDDAVPPPVRVPPAVERHDRVRGPRHHAAPPRSGSRAWASAARSRTSACSASCPSSTTSRSPSSATSPAVARRHARLEPVLPAPRARPGRPRDGAPRAVRPGRPARPSGAQPAVRRSAPARDRPRGRHSAEAPPARRAERRA